jgi:hypothetical protein
MRRQLTVIDPEALRRRSARQSRTQFHSLSDVIDDYIQRHRVSAAAEMDFFRDESFPVVIEYAALYKLANGHRHPHSEVTSRFIQFRCESFGVSICRSSMDVDKWQTRSPASPVDGCRGGLATGRCSRKRR